MSQKFIKMKNKNTKSPAYGKYFVQAVYDEGFVGTDELAQFIQTQASVKKSDIIAVLTELGEAMKHKAAADRCIAVVEESDGNGSFLRELDNN